MSTRANILLKDNHDQLWFYRHSDGYPEGTMPTLEKFLDAVKSHAIRDNVSQAGGWLILMGAQEYCRNGSSVADYNPGTDAVSKYDFSQWKVGAIEPTTCQHGDIDYLYTVDLSNKTITTQQV